MTTRQLFYQLLFYCRDQSVIAANVDLKPLFNHYKCACITYICSYFLKDKTECFQAITNATKEARNSILNVRDSLRKIGAAFLSTREVGAQECVYRCMLELWLRKVFPKTLYICTDFQQNRLHIPKSQDDLEELDDDGTDIFKSNIIECTVTVTDQSHLYLLINYA